MLTLHEEIGVIKAASASSQLACVDLAIVVGLGL